MALMLSGRANRLGVRRALAGFISSVYLVLCTFGALTHNHAICGGDDQEFEQATCPLSGPHAFPHIDQTGADSGSRCVFCEWQTASVSPALPPQHIEAPVIVHDQVNYLVRAAITVYLPLASSRAPPIT